MPNAREAEAEDESDLGELEYAPEETSGGLTVRAALYRVHAATQAPLSVVHALVMRTLHCAPRPAPYSTLTLMLLCRHGRARARHGRRVCAWSRRAW